MWRPPVYPVFLGILKSIFGNSHFLFYGTIVQHIVFLISIYYFYKLATIIINSNNISLIITVFYALYPCVPTWNCFMITEPFAIYGIIFMLYSAFMAYHKESALHIAAFTFWMLFLIFLRPAQMYILPVFLVGWIILFVKKRKLSKTIIGGILGVAFSIGAITYYSYAFKNNYGIFTPSGIGVINRYYISRLDGVIYPEYTNNQGLKQYIEKTIKVHGQKYSGGTDHDLYMETEEAIYTYGLREVSDLVDKSERTDMQTYVRRFFQRLHRAANDKMFSTLIHKWKNVTDIIGVNIKIIYWLLIIYPMLLTYWMIRWRQIAWQSIILYMLGFSHLFLIIYACQNVWDRLIIPAVPIYIIMIGQLFKQITADKISYT